MTQLEAGKSWKSFFHPDDQNFRGCRSQCFVGHKLILDHTQEHCSCLSIVGCKLVVAAPLC